MSQSIETAPALNVTVAEIEAEVLPELTKYHEIYSALFTRREQSEQSEKYMRGLLTNIENKSAESIILQLVGDDANAIRASQQFISQGSWSDTSILARHWQEVDQDLGDLEGVLIVDGSDFPKQGAESVGVKRQMCGELGKVANCQAGVFLSYASQHGYTLLDRRLYLPPEWVAADEYAQRRSRCGVPEAIIFQTKPELAAAMVSAVHDAAKLRYRWLTCDAAFGRDTAFLDTVSADAFYLAEVEFDTRAWLTQPVTAIPPGSGQGRPPTRLRLGAGEPDAQTLAAIAQTLPGAAWLRLTVKEGSKGPLVADFACLRVIAVRNALPGPEVWLVFRRHPETGEMKYYLSNAPQMTTIHTFAWLSRVPWYR